MKRYSTVKVTEEYKQIPLKQQQSMFNISFVILIILRTLKNLTFVGFLLKYLKHFISSYENFLL